MARVMYCPICGRKLIRYEKCECFRDVGIRKAEFKAKMVSRAGYCFECGKRVEQPYFCFEKRACFDCYKKNISTQYQQGHCINCGKSLWANESNKHICSQCLFLYRKNEISYKWCEICGSGIDENYNCTNPQVCSLGVPYLRRIEKEKRGIEI